MYMLSDLLELSLILVPDVLDNDLLSVVLLLSLAVDESEDGVEVLAH